MGDQQGDREPAAACRRCADTLAPVKVLVVTNITPDPKVPGGAATCAIRWRRSREAGVDAELFAFAMGSVRCFGPPSRSAGACAASPSSWSTPTTGSPDGAPRWRAHSPLAGHVSRHRRPPPHGRAALAPAHLAPRGGRGRLARALRRGGGPAGLPRDRAGAIAVLPAGADRERFTPVARDEARRRLGLDPDGRYLLFPAAPFRPEKRHDLAARGRRAGGRRTPHAGEHRGRPRARLGQRRRPPSSSPPTTRASASPPWRRWRATCRSSRPPSGSPPCCSTAWTAASPRRSTRSGGRGSQRTHLDDPEARVAGALAGRLVLGRRDGGAGDRGLPRGPGRARLSPGESNVRHAERARARCSPAAARGASRGAFSPSSASMVATTDAASAGGSYPPSRHTSTGASSSRPRSRMEADMSAKRRLVQQAGGQRVGAVRVVSGRDRHQARARNSRRQGHHNVLDQRQELVGARAGRHRQVDACTPRPAPTPVKSAGPVPG